MIRKLHHYNVLTRDLDETIRFYTEVLGLHKGWFPGTGNFGAWLYDQTETPVLHLGSIANPDDPNGALAHAKRRRDALTGSPEFALDGSGSIDHIAFDCGGFDEAREKLRALGIKYVENDIPGMDFKQLFVTDPNGITVELNFGNISSNKAAA